MGFFKTKHADLVRKLCCFVLGITTFGCFGARDPAPDAPWLKDLPEAMRKEGIFFHHLYHGQLSPSDQQTLVGRHFSVGQDAKITSNIPIGHEWWYLSLLSEVRKITQADDAFYFGIPAGVEEARFDEFWTETDIKFLQESHPLLRELTSTSKDGWDYAIWRQRIYDAADIYHNVGELTFYRIGGRWFSENGGKDSSRPNKGSRNGLIKVRNLHTFLPKDIENARAFVSKLYNQASIVRSFKDQSIFFSISSNDWIVLPSEEEYSPWPEHAKKLFTKNFSAGLADKGDLAFVGEQFSAHSMREVPMSKEALASGTYRQFAPSQRQITFQELAYISLRVIPSHTDYFAYEFNFSGKAFRFKVAVDEYETFEIKLFELPSHFKGFGVLEIGDLGHALIIDMNKIKENKRKKSIE